MGLFSFWRNPKPFDPTNLGTPWDSGPSLYQLIDGARDKVTGRLSDEWLDLPDSEPAAPHRIRFAAGLMDGMLGCTPKESARIAKEVFRRVRRAVSRTDKREFKLTYEYLAQHSAISYVDRFNEHAVRSLATLGDELAALGRHLLRHAAHREVIKFAINLIGVCGDRSDHLSLMAIGAHSEFTLFAVVALQHSGGTVESTWSLARRTSGWGRVRCIERLDTEFDSPALERWLITEGCMNSIDASMTAAICARRGNLVGALDTSAVDDRVLDGAAEILSGLAQGNPGEGMGGYSDSADASRRFLTLILRHSNPRISWLLTAHTLRSYAADPSRTQRQGWSSDAVKACLRLADEVMNRDLWHGIVESGLCSSDRASFHDAATAAEHLGWDIWERRFARLERGEDQWYALLETRDESRFRRMLDYATIHIDLAAIATGYGDALGFGPEFAEHAKLSWVLQALRHWPGFGESFIVAGMQSPVIRNRMGAIQAAIAWPREKRVRIEGMARRLAAFARGDKEIATLQRLLDGVVEEAPDDR